MHEVVTSCIKLPHARHESGESGSSSSRESGSSSQSTLRPPDVHIVYRKIGIYMVHIGDNDMHGARGGKKRCHKHSPSQLELKALLGSI